MNGTWIHLNLKTNWNIKKSNPDNKYMFKVNSRNTRTRCHIFKVSRDNSRVMVSFYSGEDRLPWHGFQANIYLYKVNNIYTRISYGICSKLTTNSKEQCQWRRPNVFIDNHELVSPVILVFLLLTLGMFLFARLDGYNAA